MRSDSQDQNAAAEEAGNPQGPLVAAPASVPEVSRPDILCQHCNQPLTVHRCSKAPMGDPAVGHACRDGEGDVEARRAEGKGEAATGPLPSDLWLALRGEQGRSRG